MPQRVRTAVFPVAGLGTRFLPATKAMPKEMLTVVDRPLIQYAVDEAREAGIEHFVFVTGRGKAVIEDYFDIQFELEQTLKARNKNAELSLLDSLQPTAGQTSFTRQQEPLGLGHAVWMAKDIVREGPFGVMLGDDMIDAKPAGLKQLVAIYESVKKKVPNAGVVMLSEVPDSEVSKYGICEVESRKSMRVTSCVEKPKPTETKSRLAIMGRYLLPLDIFKILEKQRRGSLGEIQLTDGLNQLALEGRLFGCILKGQRFDAGDRLGFLKANIHYYLKSSLKNEVRKLLEEVLS